MSRISAARCLHKKLFKDILQVDLGAPAPAFCEGQRHAVSAVDLGEQIGIGGIDYQAAAHARHGIGGEHGALAGTAAGDNKISRA